MSATILLTVLAPLAVAEPLIRNGGFEQTVVSTKPGAPGTKGWRVVPAARGGAPLAPAGWTLSSHYAGELTVLADGAASGTRCLRIRGARKRPAHICQDCKALEPGRRYKVSLSLRGGRASVMFYQYLDGGRITTGRVLTYTAPAGQWRRAVGYYSPPRKGLRYVTLAVVVPGGKSVVIDNVAIEEAGDPKPVTLETDTVRLTLSGDGRLASLVSKATGTEYAVPDTTEPVFTAKRGEQRFVANSVRRTPDGLQVRFGDAHVVASLRVTRHPGYWRFEVTDVQPADVSMFGFAPTVRVLAHASGPMGASYDDQFGIAHMPITPNTISWVRGGKKKYTLQVAWYRRLGGMKGGACVLVAVPFKRFATTIQKMERDNGLPCPMFDGQWAKVSDRVRRSYLFVTRYEHGDVDELIRYAKIGGFDLILFLMNTAFKNYGHYEINRKSFPEGLKTLREVSDKIHAAGLHVGVHLFGPSVSVGDAYVTPKPDERLCYLPCPPLTQAVDAKAKTLTLAGAPEHMPYKVVRIGDEIVTFTDVDKGPPYRLTGCLRGAFRTQPGAHKAGATVRAMLRIGRRYNFLLANHETSILKEMTERFGHVVNHCRLDMVYFDGAGGFGWNFRDRLYFLQKWLLAYYKAFDHDVLFQYSSGTGHGVLWHFIPRAASADGHGDLKWYMDERLKFVLGMKTHFTAPDVGWYGLDMNWKPDQLEYVAARCLGADGSISVQANLDILNKHPRAREIMEMLGRYERCRLAKVFPDTVKQKLLAKKREFRLFGKDKATWRLYRAAYDAERRITALDGKDNAWTVTNPLDRPCRAAVEIERREAQAATPNAYEQPGAVVLADSHDMAVYSPSEHNQYAKYARGPRRVMLTEGPAMQNVAPRLARSADGGRNGGACLVFSATNNDKSWNGWCGRGKRFSKPMDLSAYNAFAMWVHGDGLNETFFAQLVDGAGRVRNFNVPVSFKGWQFCSFHRPARRGFDWKRVEYLILYMIRIPARGKSVSVRISPIKALSQAATPTTIDGLTVAVGDRRLDIRAKLGPHQCITTDGLGRCTLWPGGMTPGQKIDATGAVLMLQPGANKITFTTADPATYAGDVSVRISRIWPLEK